MPDILVPNVPDERVADFYRHIAEFFSPERPKRPNASGSVDPALDFWRRLSPGARLIFAHLGAFPNQKFEAEELATRFEISNGRSGLAGLFGWPAQHAKAVGIECPWHWQNDGLETHYWLDSSQAAFIARGIELYRHEKKDA
jgi:Family of unknown function (DUF6416)